MIQPIETTYNGYRFRSRLEARWAVFFDTLGVPYEYEKEGFDLGEAGWYLPDFWLPTVTLRGQKPVGIWIEIKGQAPTREDKKKCKYLALYANQPVVMFVGIPCTWRDRDACAIGATDNGYQWMRMPGAEAEAWWDNCMSFMQCHECEQVKIEFEEGNYCYCPDCGATANDESPGLLKAYAAARQARFERGR